VSGDVHRGENPIAYNFCVQKCLGHSYHAVIGVCAVSPLADRWVSERVEDGATCQTKQSRRLNLSPLQSNWAQH
jgi:hypothetical protein